MAKTTVRSKLQENLKQARKWMSGDKSANVTVIRSEDFKLPEAMNGDDVRRVRKKLGFTQAQLAAVLGESIRTVQGWEMKNGRRSPNGAARRLMEMLWRSPDSVLSLV